MPKPFAFTVDVCVHADEYSEALEKLTEAIVDCERSVVFIINYDDKPVVMHDDFAEPDQDNDPLAEADGHYADDEERLLAS
jgi:RecA/RadA recombinase